MTPRRLHAALAALALTLAATTAIPQSAGATAGFALPRLAGADRYATAAAVATASFGSSDDAVIASGENFPDALAGNYLAGRRSAPLLLARRSGVPAPTMSALRQLGVRRVTLLGGEGALGSSVVSALSGAGFVVERVAGSDRFESAAAIATAGGAPPSGVALLASGRNFPDALAAGPIAFGSGIPQLLTEPGGLHPAAASALAALGIHTVVILGGTGAVSPAVEAALGAGGLHVSRLAGSSRYDTSVAIAEWAIGALGHRADHVDVATGSNFPDALAGGAHTGNGRGTILLVEPAPAGGAAARYLAAHVAEVSGGHAFGGPSAISDSALATLVAAGRPAASAPPPPGPQPDPVAACESTLLGLIAASRAQAGLAPIAVSTAAAPIARRWAQHLAATQSLAHNPRLAAELQAAGVSWTAWAENVANGADPAHVHGIFLASGIHRGNMLGDYTHTAAGCAYDGAGVLWVTEVFYRT